MASLPSDIPIRAVDAAGGEHECRITCDVAGRAYHLTAIVDRGEPLSVEAGDCFEGLRLIRRQLDRENLRLCCAGARRDVWSSGMQRDMGMGLTAYVLTVPRTEQRPPVVGIFDAAETDTVATVADQEAFYQEWLASPRDA
jgi:hypothetical protein